VYDEDDLLPLSALHQLAWCPRRCALIHIERLWDDNVFTAAGRLLHERTHEFGDETRAGVRIVRGLWLRCMRLGLWGQVDVVEFHKVSADEEAADDSAGVVLPGLCGRWAPYPVEYKRGKPRPERCDDVQLCGQAFCLEEMLNVRVRAGAVFYGEPRRRKEVFFDDALRAETAALAARLHEMVRSGVTPPATRNKHCRSCSLESLCLPKTGKLGRRVEAYLASAISDTQEGG
jgi:CRISPR-associated exonuclease Cas4